VMWQAALAAIASETGLSAERCAICSVDQGRRRSGAAGFTNEPIRVLRTPRVEREDKEGEDPIVRAGIQSRPSRSIGMGKPIPGVNQTSTS
jgi:hypothetical protein